MRLTWENRASDIVLAGGALSLAGCLVGTPCGNANPDPCICGRPAASQQSADLCTQKKACEAAGGQIAATSTTGADGGPVVPPCVFADAGRSDAGTETLPDGSVTNDGSSTQANDSGSIADTGGASDGGGIAAKYPGDIGIANDPDVIFADDFESYTQASDLTQKWDNFFQASLTNIAMGPGNVWAGQKALEFTLPQQTVELSNGVQKILKTELDVLYLRFYSKFDKSFDVTGSSHNGGGINAHYFNGFNATPGVPANGTNKFLIEYECWRGQVTDTSPGQLNVYIYHPEQRSNYGDHFFPSGLVQPNTSIPNNFGPTFVSRPDITPALDRWYEYEVMLKANTPGQRDGRVTLWLDGKLIGDFPNLRFRDVDTLKIDRFNLSLHAGSNPVGVTHKWYDNVVAAKSYVGPMSP